VFPALAADGWAVATRAPKIRARAMRARMGPPSLGPVTDPAADTPVTDPAATPPAAMTRETATQPATASAAAIRGPGRLRDGPRDGFIISPWTPVAVVAARRRPGHPATLIVARRPYRELTSPATG
jgi:hypothetical protein